MEEATTGLIPNSTMHFFLSLCFLKEKIPIKLQVSGFFCGQVVKFYYPSLILMSWPSLWENIFLSEPVSWSISNIAYIIAQRNLHQNKQTENHIFFKAFQLIRIIAQ